MFIRRSHLRLPALTAALVLLSVGVADAFRVKACPHHGGPGAQGADMAHAGHGEAVAAAHERAGRAHGDRQANDRGAVDHGAADGSVAHASVPRSTAGTHAGHGAGHTGCDCGFFCLGVAGPPTVEAPPTVDEGVPSEPASEPQSPEDHDVGLRPTAVPFLLPYSNGPPAHS